NDVDFFEVEKELGEKKLRLVMEPTLTLSPNTRRDRNIPAELRAAGARIAFVPRRDTVESHKLWLKDVGELLRAGLDRQSALSAVTLEPASVLGLSERLGSLDKGKDANLVFWNGDPFEPGSQVKAVMLEGAFVFGEVPR